MSEKILLIDAYSIINRAFYGIPDLTNSEGIHTNAVYGFLNIFFSTYTKVRPDYILVAFDVKQKTFRHLMYEQYKGTRKPMPEELQQQVPVLKDILHAMNIRTVELPGYEADDIIGTYSRKAESEGMDVVILSGDRDLLQLATEKVMISLPKTKGGKTEYEEYFSEDVLKKYQVTPTEFIDLKSLMGDQSDNIPGIPGIGEKTATAIITKYSSLESALEHADEIKPKKASENLRLFRDQGILSKKLAAINTDSPVECDMHEGRIASESIFYNDESYSLFKKYELNRLLSRFDAKNAENRTDITYQIRTCAELLCEDIKQKEAGLYVNENASLAAICFPDNTITVYTDDTSAAVSSDSQMSFNFSGMAAASDIKPEIIKLLSSGKKIYVFGLKKLLHILDMRDFESRDIYDIEVMSYLLNPLQNSYTYDIISKDHLDRIVPSKEDLIGRMSPDEAYKISENADKCRKIAALSAETALKSFPVLKEALEDADMWNLFREIEMPLTYSLYNMEREGVKVDAARLAEFSEYLGKSAESLSAEIFKE
ncbi:MAG: DNA polymerase I, partial [Parasporobacterium sp.]|nr:DNA polymerase I [Parasporobacterium sp.]